MPRGADRKNTGLAKSTPSGIVCLGGGPRLGPSAVSRSVGRPLQSGNKFNQELVIFCPSEYNRGCKLHLKQSHTKDLLYNKELCNAVLLVFIKTDVMLSGVRWVL